MKKKFVKVALLSVLTCGAPAMFTSCDDDGWKDRTNVLDQEMAEKGELINKLTEQTKALDTQIAQYKQQGEAAQKSADDAMAAAQKAQTAGDDAMAAAKAADAAAKLAEASAAEAKKEAAEALKKQYDELIALIEANTKEIAANKALIEGNTALIEQYKGLIDGNTVKINDNAGAIEKILADLKNYATSEDLKGVTEELNQKLEAAGVQAANAITELNGTVAGINAAVITLQGQAEALGVKVDGIEKAMNEQLGTLESNLVAKIEAEAKLRADGDAALQSQINSLKDEIGKLNLATNLEEFTKFISETNTQIAALKAYDDKLTTDLSALASKVTAAEKLIKENQDKIATLTTDLKAASDKAAANAKAITDQAVLIKANADSIAKINTSITELNNDIKNLKEGEIADLQGYVTKLDAQMSVMNETLDQLVNELSGVTPYIITMTMDQLRGLVFIPDAFVGGIESALSYKVHYQALTAISNSGKTLTATGFNGEKYTVPNYPTYNLAIANNAKEWLINPLTEISYHLNPTSAKVDFNDLSIVTNDAEILSRASSTKISLIKDYGCKIANGTLTVAIEGDAPVYDANNKKMPVFALQAKVYTEEGEDGKTVVTNVTSDYAMFVQMDLHPSAISINQPSYQKQFGMNQWRGDKTVFESLSSKVMADGKEVEGVFTATVANVVWNGTADLGSIMQINYFDAQRNQDGVWTSTEEWEKFGLKMNFSLVDYTIGNNGVSESSWAVIDPETGIITPCVNRDASKQSTDELGHTPLVRVTVTDTENNNNIVLQGFIRIKIVPSVEDYVTETLTYDNLDFNCNPGTNGIEKNENVLNMMLNATGLTKDVFLAHYKPLTINENELEILQQVVKKDGAWIDTDGIGDVICQYVATQAPDATNAPDNVTAINPEYHFVWDLDVEAKQKAYEMTNHVGRTYICFKGDDADIFPNVYLPLEVTINNKPVANVGTKMEARWFRDMTTALLNVEQPTNGQFVETIKTDLDLLWQGQKPTFTKVSGQPNLNASTYATENGLAGGYRYYFPDVQKDIDGVKFTVTNKTNPCLIGGSASNANMGNHALMVVKDGAFVSNGEYSNNQIFANGKLLAELDQNTGEITFATTPEAQTLLNKYASNGDGLNRTNAKLQVQVGVVAYNECGIALQLAENSVIPSTFLRPINIVDAKKSLNFTDATANGSKVNVYDLLDFSDWRGVDFAKNEWLFAYYNVQKVEINLAGIKSNAANINTDPTKFTVDSSVNQAFSLEGQSNTNFTANTVNSGNSAAIKSTVSNAFGKIVYDNRLLNVQQFEVQIPMTIYYQLGKFDVIVNATVKSTMGGN
ncbi:MAG: hypothetical protein HDS44_03970 [Bacteroides sp.]|nr:hypothetical protein [Bacteroides sp.]